MFKKRKGKKANLKANNYNDTTGAEDKVASDEEPDSGEEDQLLQHQLMRKNKSKQKKVRKDTQTSNDNKRDDERQEEQASDKRERKKKSKKDKRKNKNEVGGFVPNIEALEIESPKMVGEDRGVGGSRAYTKDLLAQMKQETQFIPQPGSTSNGKNKETEINRLIARDEFRDHDDDGTDYGKVESERVKNRFKQEGQGKEKVFSGFRFERDQNIIEEMYESFQSERNINVHADADTGSQKTVSMEIEEASDDEELRRWEDSKIRKAAKGADLPPGVSHAASGFQTTMRIISTPEDVLSSLAKRLSIMENNHEQNERELTRLKVEQNAWDEEKRKLDDQIKICSTTFEDMQRFHVYVLGLCNCLASKSVKINQVESSIRSMEKRTVDAARQERLQAFADVIHKVEDIRDKFIVISRGDRGLFPMNDFWPSGREDSDNSNVDELGRDLSYLKERELDIRMATLENRLSIHLKQDLGKIEIDAVDLEMDLNTYRERRGNMIKALDMIFEDVDSEFSSAAAVIKNLKEWKRKYKSEYNQAFVSDSLPEILAPFMQIEFLRWDTLDPYIENKLERLTWFDDVDEQVKVKLLEKMCLPSFHYILASIYDPLCVVQTQAILRLFEWIVSKAHVLNVDVFSDKKVYMSKKGILDILAMKLKDAEAVTCLPLVEYGCYHLCDAFTSRQLEYSLLLMRTLEMVVRSLNALKQKYVGSEVKRAVGDCLDEVIGTTRKLAEKQVRLVSHIFIQREKGRGGNEAADEYYFNHGILILKRIVEHFTPITELVDSPGSQWFNTLRQQMNELL